MTNLIQAYDVIGGNDNDYDCMIMVIQGWGWEACTYTCSITYIQYNNTQTKLATLMIFTLNTLTMKMKS